MTRKLTSLAAAAVLVSACSSPKDPKRSEFGPTYRERIGMVDKIIKNKDFSQRSSFEKQLPRTKSDKEYKASTFAAKEAAGLKKFSGADKASGSKAFAEAGKTSRAGQKGAREAEAQNKLAAKLFRTPDSRFEGKTNREATKAYEKSAAVFPSRENRAGTVELEKNKKPVILPPEKPSYSEDEVKRLLNKS